MNLFKEFYPTPKKLIAKIIKDFEIPVYHYKEVLEPSAGKGDLAEYIRDTKHTIYEKGHSKHFYEEKHSFNGSIDCIELAPELRSVLSGKNFRVVYDDFLRYQTYKQYDLILLNPPFSEGDAHLLKALSMVESGGDVVCILNAETIRNPYTNRRKELAVKLRKMDAKIRYYQSAFTTAERTTKVEVAAIYVSVPKKQYDSAFLKGLKEKHYAEYRAKECTDVGFADSIKNAIIQYNIDIEAGIKLIREFKSLKKTFKSSFVHKYGEMIQLKVDGDDVEEDSKSFNDYIKMVRRKYWEALFENPDFTKQMTSNLKQQYENRIKDLVNYDFNEYNIREIKIDITKKLVRGVEECIVALFDELTEKHAWYPECDNNIHYFNGWASNKSWIINQKVVMPYNAYHYQFDDSKKLHITSGSFYSALADMERVLTYLDTKGTQYASCYDVLSRAQKIGQTKNIELKYFTITVYKKGTCHIRFKDKDLLKKLNIYGCQRKGWLPPAYGKKKYADMSEKEQAVINEFEGKESYEDTFRRKDYFLSGASGLLGIDKVG